jgi:hypothetical protein
MSYPSGFPQSSVTGAAAEAEKRLQTPTSGSSSELSTLSAVEERNDARTPGGTVKKVNGGHKHPRDTEEASANPNKAKKEKGEGKEPKPKGTYCHQYVTIQH